METDNIFIEFSPLETDYQQLGAAAGVSPDPTLKSLSDNKIKTLGTVFERGLTATEISSFRVDKDFFRVSDTFSFEISGEENQNLIQEIKRYIAPGQPLTIKINGKPKLVGFVDSLKLSYSSSGTNLSISGRDKLGVVVDSCLTPETQANPKDTLLTALTKAFSPFGWSQEDLIFKREDESIYKNQDLNVTVGSWKAKTARRNFQNPEAQIGRIHRAKKGEGCIQFAQRICDLNGLFINLSPDGKKILITPPVYDRDDNFKFSLTHLIQSDSVRNNILSGNIEVDWSKQASVILVEGTSGGGTFRKQTSKTIVINELVGYNPLNGKVLPNIQEVIDKSSLNISGFREYLPINEPLYLAAQKLEILKINNQVIRPLYIYNSNTNNKSELSFFARRQMADLQAKSVKLKYRVQGFTQDDKIWSHNLLANVQDDFLNVNGDFWISKVSHSKSLGGTFTDIELQLPYVFDYI